MDNFNIADIIVVGSGLSGLCAAIAAAEGGAETVIVEKMPVIGGSSANSVGAFAVCGSTAQKRIGINDNHDLFYNDILCCGENENTPELVKIMVKNSSSAFKFIKDRGANYGEKLFDVEGHSVRRCFQTPAGLGNGVIKPLTAYFLTLPKTQIMLKTMATDIIKDESGAVTGLRLIENYDFPYTTNSRKINIYKARKAVIFATGGFERDASKMLHLDNMRFSHIPSDTHIGATADALLTLEKAGAALYQTSFLRFGSSIALNDIAKGILIDFNTQKRFINENLPRKKIMDKIINIGGGQKPPIIIFDKKATINMANDEKLDTTFAKGELQQFDSLHELAEFFNFNFNDLHNEINRYNRFIKSGLDEDFGKDFMENKIYEINEPPFYACPIYPKLNYTQGGVAIDINAKVLDENQTPIKRLYAAGQTTGGIHGKARLTCCSTLDCTVFGIIAGKNAVKEKII